MNYNNQLADFVARLKIGILNKKILIQINYTKFNIKLLQILLEQGCIKTFYINSNKKKLMINVELKYINNQSIITNIECVSCPSLRIYKSLKMIIKTFEKLNFNGFWIITTSSGLITSDNLILPMENHLIDNNVLSGEVLIKITF